MANNVGAAEGFLLELADHLEALGPVEAEKVTAEVRVVCRTSFTGSQGAFTRHDECLIERVARTQ